MNPSRSCPNCGCEIGQTESQDAAECPECGAVVSLQIVPQATEMPEIVVPETPELPTTGVARPIQIPGWYLPVALLTIFIGPCVPHAVLIAYDGVPEEPISEGLAQLLAYWGLACLGVGIVLCYKVWQAKSRKIFRCPICDSHNHTKQKEGMITCWKCQGQLTIPR